MRADRRVVSPRRVVGVAVGAVRQHRLDHLRHQTEHGRTGVAAAAVWRRAHRRRVDGDLIAAREGIDLTAAARATI